MIPLLSVVIPTFQRPGLLGRAIASALNAAPTGEVEVVVVPNGADISWQRVAQEYANDARINWHPIPVGNACAARNHGLAQARGKYIRFLDNDDYLYPAAIGQIELIESQRADMCSAPLENILPNGRKGHTYCLPASSDFPTVALLSMGIAGLTQGTIFLKSRIADSRWREDIVLYDDYFWMIELAGKRERTWLQSTDPVGAYVHHHAARLSRTQRSIHNSRPLVRAILELHRHLSETRRVTPERTHATATALLTHAHSAFPSSPFFLGTAIRQARKLDPNAIPLQPLFQDHPWLARNILGMEWAMIAPRYVSRCCRRALWSLASLHERAYN